jgi:hypothetical protein
VFCWARCETQQQQQPDNGKNFWSNKNKTFFQPTSKQIGFDPRESSGVFLEQKKIYATQYFFLFFLSLSRIHI